MLRQGVMWHLQGRSAISIAFLHLVVWLSAPALCRRSVFTPTQPDASTFRCFGATPDRRSCVFSNVFYNLNRSIFYVSGNASGIVHSEVSLTPKYDVRILTQAPDEGVVHRREGLTVFWKFNGGVGYSFGHALVHALFPLFNVLHYLLGDDIPTRLDIVSDLDSVPAVFNHISVVSHNRIHNWQQLQDQAHSKGKAWIHFSSLILGEGQLFEWAQSLSNNQHPPPSFYNDAAWWTFRAWMYRSVGLDPAPAAPVSPCIIINEKTMDTFNHGKNDRRRILNTKELQEHLMSAFPEAQVERVSFVQMPWKKQLQQLRNTTLFITTEGSSSFRYVFLPRGAAAIVVAHPDTQEAAAPPLASEAQFHELDRFFPLAYVRFMRYAVDINNTNEYEPVENMSDQDLESRRRHGLYSANIIVNLTRMEHLVRLGLQQQKLQQWLRPWSVTGALDGAISASANATADGVRGAAPA